MFVACVTVYVKPEFIEAFAEATKENARNSRREPGNLRFDVLQCMDDETRFFLYEVYHNEDGMRAHKETDHYKKWRETVEGWMAKPREGVRHTNLFPTSPEEFTGR